MVVSGVKPHVPPEAAPQVVIKLLRELADENSSFPTVKALRQFSEDVGVSGRSEIPIVMSNLGLLENDSDGGLQLSRLAHDLLRNEEKVLVDLLHFLFFSEWSERSPEENSDSWGYRQVSTIFWEHAPVDVVSLTDYVTEEVRNRALLQFGEDVSFSPKSVRGVRKWLEALSPPVINAQRMERRQFVHPQLLILAIAWAAQKSGADIGIDLLLTPELRESICRVCLLEPSALDQSLDWMLPVYPSLVGSGTTAGIYGRFIQFHRWPTISDLVSGV